MSPPAVIASIVRPCICVFIIEMKETTVRALLAQISTRLISALMQIDFLPVEPLVKRTTVVEHTVDNHSHPALVHLLHEIRKQLITCRQICRIGTASLIAGCFLIGNRILCNNLPAILHDDSVMRINVLIVLTVILVIGRRDKERIEVNDLDTEVLKIIEFFTNPRQISAIETADIHRRRILLPVLNLVNRTPDIDVLPLLHIVVRISIAEAIHKNLVYHRTLCPLRRMKAGSNHKRSTEFCML